MLARSCISANSGAQWRSLSIARGGSGAFNNDKFAHEKRRQHFTDEFLAAKKDDEEREG